MRHPIEQPGFNIEAFQETPLYARITATSASGQRILATALQEGQVLAELYVPDMEDDLKQKEAAVRQAERRFSRRRPRSRGPRPRGAVRKSQYERLARVGKEGMLDKDSVAELHSVTRRPRPVWKRPRPTWLRRKPKSEVAKANRDYSRTMLLFAKIKAPYAGVVTQRNVNQGDFVQPAGVGAKGQPLYVVSQIDPVRVFVNMPGADAGWVQDGDPVTLRLQGAGGQVFHGKVTRNARSLNPLARTLRTEIDLPNPDGKLLPGMYVQASITVEHPDVWTLPAAAVATVGDQTFCYRVENGKAVKTPLQVGLRGGGLVEVLKLGVKATASSDVRWEPIAGTEDVVAGEADAISDGMPVRQAPTGK